MLTGLQLNLLALLMGFIAVQAASHFPARQSISTLSPAQVAAFKPYTHYAGAAHCDPANTFVWNCGANCNANSAFQPVASGGDGASTQYWYVGYDPALKTVIVSYQGTDVAKIIPLVTDLDFFLMPLDSSLFPGISGSIKVHDGFRDAQARSATSVLSAVTTALSENGANEVTVVGHSLGGAIAMITSIYLPLHLPSNTSFRTVAYGTPRVGNQAFADYVDTYTDITHINNRRDVIPTIPGRFMGFVHPRGEKHIIDSGAWINCPGQDNTDAQCTIGYVPNILQGDIGDHTGPYDGVTIGC